MIHRSNRSASQRYRNSVGLGSAPRIARRYVETLESRVLLSATPEPGSGLFVPTSGPMPVSVPTPGSISLLSWQGQTTQVEAGQWLVEFDAVGTSPNADDLTPAQNLI